MSVASSRRKIKTAGQRGDGDGGSLLVSADDEEKRWREASGRRRGGWWEGVGPGVPPREASAT